jgi:hypothetical protein
MYYNKMSIAALGNQNLIKINNSNNIKQIAQVTQDIVKILPGNMQVTSAISTVNNLLKLNNALTKIGNSKTPGINIPPNLINNINAKLVKVGQQLNIQQKLNIQAPVKNTPAVAKILTNAINTVNNVIKNVRTVVAPAVAASKNVNAPAVAASKNVNAPAVAASKNVNAPTVAASKNVNTGRYHYGAQGGMLPNKIYRNKNGQQFIIRSSNTKNPGKYAKVNSNVQTNKYYPFGTSSFINSPNKLL